MSKVKKNNDTAGWVPLTLEGTIVSEDIGGLIGIEELTDYKLVKTKNKTQIISENTTSKKTPKKKRAVELERNDDSESRAVKKKKHNTVTKDINKLKKKKKQRGIPTYHLKEKSSIDTVNEEQSAHEVEDINEIESNINVHAWTSLGVPDVIIKALAVQNFIAPTAIQSLTLPPAILGRRDILGAAETGSGKTLAFGIPILNGILELKKKKLESMKDDDDKEEKESTINDEESEEEGSLKWESDKEEDSYSGVKHEADEDDDNDDMSVESNFEEREEFIEDEMINESSVGCVRAIDNIKIAADLQTRLKKPLYALILTPTRELAIQIKNHIVKAAKYTDIKVAVIVGGMAAVKQERILSKGPEIVIATPGRLWELMDEGNPHLSQINSIKYLAIDETDRMLERGHFQELHKILERIYTDENKRKERQTFVFSATLTMVHDIPQYLQRKKSRNVKSKISKLTQSQKLAKVIEMLKISNPKIVDVTKEKGTAGSLTECRIACTIDHKDYYLYYFLKRHAGRTLVFCNSIGCVRRLATLLGILDCDPLPLHASMQQRQRLKNLERFQADENGLLIATDVAARGLDIPNVEHVIHYQVPRTSESYVHRSGRTARAQKEGITVLMMEPSELQYYTRLCKTLGRTEDLPTFPVVDRLLIAVKERVNVAREIDKLELICRRDNAQKGWLQRAVEEMDLVLDDDQLETTMETKESADLKRQLKAKKNHLKSLVAKPLFPKGFSGKYLDTNLEIHLNNDSRKAVEVMRDALESQPEQRKKSVVKGIKKNNGFKNKKKFKKGKRQ
ncbi:ATP-dependent RNA helicase DDX24 [Cephus cinctus]|uniref:ATP-dependent RNA helicase n=1 Tax=Cephus cinctus TaxID=211228 RepID=A0AAJ7FUK5_CEPCN|nr:ATP-dependent RNA helicase DDX24 [Cephus cinctus]